MARLNYYKQLLERYSDLHEAKLSREGEDAVVGDVLAGGNSKKEKSKAFRKSNNSGGVHASHLYNRGLKGTSGDVELKKQLYSALPPSPQNLPMIPDVSAIKMKGNFVPHLIQSPESASVSWNTPEGPIPSLPTGGEIGTGYNYNSFRNYLEGIIADESGEELEQVKGEHPAAGSITQNLTQDPTTGVWYNEAGDAITNPWFSWEPDNFDEILLDSKSTLGNVPGLTTRHIYRLITAAPVAYGTQDTIEFKTGLRGGYDPVLPVEAQKEMYEGFKTLMHLAGIVQEDKEGVRYIDENRLMANAKDILNSFSYSKGKGLYIGHHASRPGRDKMPFLYDMLDSVARNVDSDRSRGVTLGDSTVGLGEALGNVLLKGKDGSYKPLLRVSSFEGVAKEQSRILSKSKEAIIAGLMNATLGLSDKEDTFVDTMIRFRNSVEAMNNIATQLESGEPIGGGIIHGEEPQEELTRMLQTAGVDNIKDATMEFIKDSFSEAKIMSELLGQAGVTAVRVGGVDDVSKIGKRDDFTIELSSSEDYQKFNDFLQTTHGVKLRVDKSLPISLKTYMGGAREYKLGTTSIANGINAFNASKGASQSEALISQTGQTHGSFDNYVKTSDLFEGVKDSVRSSMVNNKNKAAETMITATKGVMSIMSHIDGSKGVSTQPLMSAFKDMVFDKSSGIDHDYGMETMKNFEAAYSKRSSKGKSDKVSSEIAKAEAAMLNLVRMSMARDKDMLQGIALNDLVATVYTEDDEALMHSMFGDVRISGRHHIVSFLMTECEPSMNNRGVVSWKYKSGKTVFRSKVRDKAGSTITEGSANTSLFNSVAKVLYRDVSSPLNEGTVKENILRKFEEILAKIDEVLPV